jgi:NRPS condensation-like uncharacterized protein
LFLFTFVGEPFHVKLLDLIVNIGLSNSNVWNLYGPAETTIDCTFHLVDVVADRKSIPIGVPLPNYRCVIMDEFLQYCYTKQDGELFVGGVGVFAGYLGRDDLTGRASIEINGEVFYRTGDLVQIDNNGLLHYTGRKDHQIKLHGQRIELGEIERCILETSISSCVAVKWGDHHLIAYVQKCNDIDEKELRNHCQSHLPPHMVPSFFIILDNLPLNANGKIDRKLLPPPSSHHLLSSDHTNNLQIQLPNDEIQISTHTLWCEIFHQKQISIDTNIFRIGGHSLLLMQLYHQYKTTFLLQTKSLSIADLFQYPTIIDHAQLIHHAMNTNQHSEDYWTTLHLTQGRNKNKLFSSFPFSHILGLASFAQERIFLDEQIRFSSQKNDMIYAIPLFYRISSLDSHISIARLHRALQSVIMKHSILRTALYFDIHGIIVQQVNVISDCDDIKSNELEIINLQNNDFNKTIHEIFNRSDLFDLSKGRVIHCHILRRYRLSLENDDDDLLMNDDMILFNIHHSAFDGGSTSVFLRDLSLVYESDCSLPIHDDDANTIQYIDYSVYEHQMDMRLSHDFWQLQLEEYNLQCRLSFPIDRQRLSTDQRSGLSSVAQITFNNDISTSFLNYASSHHLTPFQLGLACFYTFLFKLTHGHNDLCVACINANRYRSELENLIGMFVSTLPYRIQVDPYWSFDELVKYVREKCLSILGHSHYPLQLILGDFQLNQSNIPFLETVFNFITVSSDIDELSLNGTHLKQMSLHQSFELAKFDFMLTFMYNPSVDDGKLSCHFGCSRDLFDETTVSKVAQRLEHLIFQLFSSNGSANRFHLNQTPLSKLCIILPQEVEEMQEIIFCRQANVVNEGMFNLFVKCLICDKYILAQNTFDVSSNSRHKYGI